MFVRSYTAGQSKTVGTCNW